MKREGTHNLMQHKALPVYLYRDPLDLAINLWILHLQANHIPLDSPIIERFPDRVIVKITIHTSARSSICLAVSVTHCVPLNSATRSLNRFTVPTSTLHALRRSYSPRCFGSA